jgi:hypothetical protein
MAKNCLIYETLNGVKEMKVKRSDEGLMTLSGVFGVCGVRNNNQRVYETSNYSKMVAEMQERIKNEGGIPGELEHPQLMNITLENVSHKITDINIDENGLVTGSITLLNTPKGQIAQAIVEGGLPLFISSRATGQVDKNSGNVTLERIATYDLVGSPGFSQAKLHLNENQVAESINESAIFYITEKEEEVVEEPIKTEEPKIEENENNNIDEMELKEILEKVEALESRIAELEDMNSDLQAQIDEKADFDLEKLANGIQKWIVEEYSPLVQKWIVEEFAAENNEELVEEAVEAAKEMFIEEMAPKIQNWIVEEYTPEVEKWTVNEFGPEVEKWCIEEFAPGIQKWIVEEYAPEVDNWVSTKITESINESKKNGLSAIDETLTLLENIEATKPTYSRKSLITENANEPKYIQDMPADVRVKYDLASADVKESIQRRAKIYDFTCEGAVEKFWNSINFDNIKPAKSIYEGLENIIDERERNIRASLRSWRNRK